MSLTSLRVCVTLSDDPRIFCYRAPQFNIWRAFHDVSFEVSSQGTVPFVHAAAEDSLRTSFAAQPSLRPCTAAVAHRWPATYPTMSH